MSELGDDVGLCLHASGLFLHEHQEGVKFTVGIINDRWMCRRDGCVGG